MKESHKNSNNDDGSVDGGLDEDDDLFSVFVGKNLGRKLDEVMKNDGQFFEKKGNWFEFFLFNRLLVKRA